MPPAGVPDWYDDLPNEFLRHEWSAIPGPAAGRLAIEAAEAVDARIASLPAEIESQVLARGERFRLARSNHRREHVDQIEAALAAAGR